MIDLNQIEAAAKAAPEGEWRYEPTGQTVWGSNKYMKYMVADIRGWGHLQYLPNGAELQDATGVHIATANPATVLELVRMIRERDDLILAFRESERELMGQRDARDAVLRQALGALESQKAYIEANEPGLVTDVPAIAAIKEILK
jgi:hypothetical protein